MIIITAKEHAIFPHPLGSLGNAEGHVEKLPRVGESDMYDANIKRWSWQTRVRGRDRN